MRILGFTYEWGKLQQDEFTTFRLKRKDKDWQFGETVQIFFKPRSKYRRKLGEAEIIRKELRPVLAMNGLTDAEAVEDGFANRDAMLRFLVKAHGSLPELMNKLTLRWIERLKLC